MVADEKEKLLFQDYQISGQSKRIVFMFGLKDNRHTFFIFIFFPIIHGMFFQVITYLLFKNVKYHINRDNDISSPRAASQVVNLEMYIKKTFTTNKRPLIF